jgi:uncharacterized membrane protein YkoI
MKQIIRGEIKMNLKTIVTITAILVILGAGIAMARPATTDCGFWNGMMGSGMMGNSGRYGHMMESGNYGGYGTNTYRANDTPITIEKAKESVEKYLAATGNTDLAIAEIIEFDNNFYAGIKEKSTGKYAIEFLVNKYTGAVVPEMGPNMMWNTKYGHMTWNTQESNTLTEKQAIEIAQKYLDTAIPGAEVEGADTYYGYYTLEVKKDGNIYGMLSVNSNTGAVWYHNWHGTFVKILEVE